MSGDIQLLFALGCAAAAWSWLARAREHADVAASRVCREIHVQRLDASVALMSCRPHLGRGACYLELRYAFEFSSDGGDRRQGIVALQAMHPAWARVELPEGALHLDLATAH